MVGIGAALLLAISLGVVVVITMTPGSGVATPPTPTPRPAPTPGAPPEATSSGGITFSAAPEDSNIAAVPSPARSVPELDDGQVGTIEGLLDSDAWLKAIVASGATYTIGRVSPWVSGDGDLIGGVAELRLSAPIAYAGILTRVTFDADSDNRKQYATREEAVQADAISSLYVLIDLGEDAIVGVEVAEAGNVVFTDKPTGN